jgi:hypothetical protein
MEIKFGGALTALARWPLSRATLVGPLPGGARNVKVLVEDARASRPELDRQRKGRRGRQ